MVKVLYTIFLAVMIALFVGFGISVFYPAPTSPEYPTEFGYPKSDGSLTEEQDAIQKEYDQKQKVYQDEFAEYNRNVAVIVILVSVLLLALSLTVIAKHEIFDNGVLMGGIFTLLYGIIRSFMTENNKYQFIAVTIGLLVAIILGYLKLAKPKSE